MNIHFNKYINQSIKLFILFIFLSNFKTIFLRAEDSYLGDFEVDHSTKIDGSPSDLPTNPFEIVEMMRRANSMNNATNPSDAIDDALNSFNEIQYKENL